MSAPTIAVSAVQGAFAEHEAVLRQLGCDIVELRRASDMRRCFDGVVLPGGESTVQAKLLRESGMMDALCDLIREGLPVLGTCAGLILLAREVHGKDGCPDPVRGPRTLPVNVMRNAYGRQLGSFWAEGMPMADLTSGPRVEDGMRAVGISMPSTACAPVPMRFIRAPRIISMAEGVETLVSFEGQPVAVRYGAQVGCAFHPELTTDTRIHARFLSLIDGMHDL